MNNRKIGYFRSCEEYSPRRLIDQAVGTEAAGFDALWISDHFHPWNDNQDQSAFVWSMIGALAQATELPVTTAVTCPTVRIHPAIIAQAVATSAVLLDGRFSLGLGSGEALNEHVTGARWPSIDTRLEMLEEAVELIRELSRRTDRAAELLRRCGGSARRRCVGRLFESLADERVWEHMSRGVPADAAVLEAVIGSRLVDGDRVTFTIRQGGRAVGITSVLFDPHDPAGAEVGGTLLDPGVWGKGVNTEVKRLLLAVLFGHGAQWVQLRTDERNGRSTAAIRKLGGTDLGTCQEPLLRRDGTRRQSRIFRIDRPGPSMPARRLGT